MREGARLFFFYFLKKNGETILPDSRAFRPTVLYLLPVAAIQSECVDELFMRLFSQIVKQKFHKMHKFLKIIFLCQI